MPAVQVTLDLLDVDGALVLASHLVDAASDADHALQRSLNRRVTAVHRVVVVHDVLHTHAHIQSATIIIFTIYIS